MLNTLISFITPRDHLRLFAVEKTDTERCKVIWPGHAGGENGRLELDPGRHHCPGSYYSAVLLAPLEFYPAVNVC